MLVALNLIFLRIIILEIIVTIRQLLHKKMYAKHNKFNMFIIEIRLFGKDYRVAMISTLFQSVSGIIIINRMFLTCLNKRIKI